MKIFSLFLFIFSLNTYASRCQEVTVLSHFNKLGSKGTFYGNEIHKGVLLAKKELKNSCYDIKKLDIGPNLLTLKKVVESQVNSDTQKFFIGLGSSNKVSAVSNILGGNLLFSPTATSNEFVDKDNIFLTSGINENIGRTIAEYSNETFSNIAIVFDISRTYTVDLKDTIVKYLKIPSSTTKTLSNVNKSDAVILLLEESDSAKAIKYIDSKKISKVVIGADIWGAKKNYVSKALNDLSYIKDVRRFYTFKETKNFDSDLMYYSYLSMLYLDEMRKNCKQTNSKCLNGKSELIEANYVKWPVKNEKIF